MFKIKLGKEDRKIIYNVLIDNAALGELNSYKKNLSLDIAIDMFGSTPKRVSLSVNGIKLIFDSLNRYKYEYKDENKICSKCDKLRKYILRYCLEGKKYV